MAKANLLIVDDHLRDYALILDVLEQQNYQVISATSGWSALALIESEPPDLILLDIEMPGMNGYEVCAQLKDKPKTRDIPVIFISVSDQLFDKVKAFSVGGADYITKPFQIEELLARIRTHLTLNILSRELAETRDELQRETAKRKEGEKIIEELSHTDYLTKAFNRRHFFELAEREVAQSEQTNQPIAIIIIDIDHLKNINNTYGSLIGDKILQNLANLSKSKIRERDIFARFGGKEFVILMPNTTLEAAEQTAERLRQVVFQSFMATGRVNVLITISLGVAGWDGEGELALETLLDEASQALNQAQDAGRNRVMVWKKPQSD